MLYSDRHAYTVRNIYADGTKVLIQRCKAVRTDGFGMSDSQSYDYSQHEDQYMTLTWFRGAWRNIVETKVFLDSFLKGRNAYELSEDERFGLWDEYGRLQLIPGRTRIAKSYMKVSILFGSRREYYDFTR